MHRSNGALLALATAAALGPIIALSLVAPIQPPPAQVAPDQIASASAAYRDIEATLGPVPAFFKPFPEGWIAGIWADFKSDRPGAKAKLDGKTKGLIGLGKAAQMPCQPCVLFRTAAAKANGATDEEIREAVAMAAIVRHRSAVLSGTEADLGTLKRETDTALRLAAEGE